MLMRSSGRSQPGNQLMSCAALEVASTPRGPERERPRGPTPGKWHPQRTPALYRVSGGWGGSVFQASCPVAISEGDLPAPGSGTKPAVGARKASCWGGPPRSPAAALCHASIWLRLLGKFRRCAWLRRVAGAIARDG